MCPAVGTIHQRWWVELTRLQRLRHDGQPAPSFLARATVPADDAARVFRGVLMTLSSPPDFYWPAECGIDQRHVRRWSGLARRYRSRWRRRVAPAASGAPTVMAESRISALPRCRPGCTTSSAIPFIQRNGRPPGSSLVPSGAGDGVKLPGFFMALMMPKLACGRCSTPNSPPRRYGVEVLPGITAGDPGHAAVSHRAVRRQEFPIAAGWCTTPQDSRGALHQPYSGKPCPASGYRDTCPVSALLSATGNSMHLSAPPIMSSPRRDGV